MQTTIPTEKSSEIKLKFLVFLFILEECVAELDATINGPAAYGHTVLELSPRDWEYFISFMIDPPSPNEALISLFRDYGNSQE